MTKMYVANGSKKIHIFAFRLPTGVKMPNGREELGNVVTYSIPMGGQVCVGDDLTTPEVDAILKQHKPYGLVDSADIDRLQAYHGLCYSLDKPVQSNRITYLLHNNDSQLRILGRQIRQETAIANNAILENEVIESGLPERVSSYESSVTVENHDDRDEEAPIAEGVRVERDTQDDARAARTQRKRR